MKKEPEVKILPVGYAIGYPINDKETSLSCLENDFATYGFYTTNEGYSYNGWRGKS